MYVLTRAWAYLRQRQLSLHVEKYLISHVVKVKQANFEKTVIPLTRLWFLLRTHYLFNGLYNFAFALRHGNFPPSAYVAYNQ